MARLWRTHQRFEIVELDRLDDGRGAERAVRVGVVVDVLVRVLPAVNRQAERIQVVAGRVVERSIGIEPEPGEQVAGKRPGRTQPGVFRRVGEDRFQRLGRRAREEAGAVAIQAEQEEVVAGHVRIGPGAREELAVAFQCLVAIVVFRTDRDVAGTAGDVGSEDRREAHFLSVACFGEVRLCVELQSLEVATQDEVGHAADGIGTVYGRGATRDDLDPLHQRRRNAVDVRHHQCVGGHWTMAIDQHEVAVRSEAAQGHRGDADGIHRRDLHILLRGDRRGRRVVGRQLVEIGLDVQAGAVFELGVFDGHQRTVGSLVAAHDARAGDLHLFEFEDVIGLCGFCRRAVAHEQRCTDGGCHRDTDEILRGCGLRI